MIKIKDGFIVRRIADQIMAVPTGKRTSDIHGVIALSESGVLLWEALEKGAEIKDLTELLLREYDVDEETASRDAVSFVESLQKQGALEE